MLQAYVDHVAERAALGIPPLPLSAKQTGELIELLKSASAKDGEFLLKDIVLLFVCLVLFCASLPRPVLRVTTSKTPDA